MQGFILVAALTTFGLSACALLERSPSSGYYEDQEYAAKPIDIYLLKQQSVEDDAREELGLGGRVLSEEERAVLENRIQLKRIEGRIHSSREKKQYFGVRGALKTDRERLQFLSMPTYEARERWATTRGLASQEENHSDEISKIIDTNDIALGMSQKAVVESWGDPDSVEVAGNPIYGNERWRFNRFVSGQEGYQKEQRIIYFEGGRVVGWERP